MQQLGPEQLHCLWQSVERKEATEEEYALAEAKLLDAYSSVWRQALLLEGHANLQESLLSELSRYLGCADLAEIRRRCQGAVHAIKEAWNEQTSRSTNRTAVEEFYDHNQAMLYELMWWHSLGEDTDPLGYVTALHFAQQRGCRTYLDFGAGVGAGGILFARHGFEVTLADISSDLLGFSKWRLHLRTLNAEYLDLKAQGFPREAFDFVTAMDVFEHLFDPAGAAEELGRAMKPGAYLFARLQADANEDRPLHIVKDFRPVFQCLEELGFKEVWRDDWVWGHHVFQKQEGLGKGAATCTST
jgi:2-polyprenyl-3-methyl-5-hydroxy-6-metoxy-1,4-benzoquinol methylase